MKILAAFLVMGAIGLQAEAGIQVMAATYGGNCGAAGGNATDNVSMQCSGRDQCGYVVDVTRLGDPCYGVPKDFSVDYTCDGRTPQQAVVPREANGRTVFLACNGGGPNMPPPPGWDRQIRIISATFGKNVRGVPMNNAFYAVQRECEGRQVCNFVVSVSKLGDPAYQRAKDFEVTYSCGGRFGSRPRTTYIPPEANGRSALISCQ